jgi:hypothetical protein
VISPYIKQWLWKTIVEVSLLPRKLAERLKLQDLDLDLDLDWIQIDAVSTAANVQAAKRPQSLPIQQPQDPEPVKKDLKAEGISRGS